MTFRPSVVLLITVLALVGSVAWAGIDQWQRAANTQNAAAQRDPSANGLVDAGRQAEPQADAELLEATRLAREEAARQAAQQAALEAAQQRAAAAARRRAAQRSKARELGLAAGQLPGSHEAVQYRGSGTVTTVPSPALSFGFAGTPYTFVVQVEDGLDVDSQAFSDTVDMVLGDSRSWAGSGKVMLTRSSSATSYDFRIVLASPDLTDTLCAPLSTDGIYSCRNGKDVVINYYRWMTGAHAYPQALDAYRSYVINHEVGHALGHDHRSCPSPGAQAPVMVQQSISVFGCVAQPWPLSSELAAT